MQRSSAPRGSETTVLSFEALESRQMLSADSGAALTDSADVYEPGDDAVVGFNMVSFVRERGRAARQRWVEGVQSMHDAGATHVTLAVFREVNHRSGRIKRSTGPGYDVIKAAADHAHALGMHVTINPLFEVTGDSSWRGEWNPTGGDARRFSRTYSRFIKDLAKVAEDHHVDRLNIGSELVAYVNDAKNHASITSLIDTTDALFAGELGYVANWSNFDSSNLASAIWDHPAIDYLGVSAYFSETFGIGHHIVDVATASNPGADLVAAAEAGWDDIFDNYLIPVSDRIRGGQLPIVIQEFGAVPFDLAGANPWSTTPSETATGVPGETPDPQEQHDIFKGLLRSLDGRGDTIARVDFWTWGFESNPYEYELFALDPSEGSPSQLATIMLIDFLHSSGE